jgi:hypothetical protein
MTQPWTDPNTATFRCAVTIDGVQANAFMQVDRMFMQERPDFREHVERRLRLQVAQEIVDKLAPEVVEVHPRSLAPDERVGRDEALRLAQVHAKALNELASRLEAAGENYALPDAWQARDAARALVDTLAGDDGRLPTDPRFWSSRGLPMPGY